MNTFADDIALYWVIKTTDDYVCLQQEIDSISACIQQKDLNFNANKCKMMFISRKKSKTLPPPQLILNGTILNREITINTWVSLLPLICLGCPMHISNCCNKTRRLIGLLYRQFHQHASSPTLLRLYISFIRPHLEYASIVWSPSLKGEIDKLEEVQKFALRVCLKSWDKNYDDLLLNSELPSLQKRRVLASLCHLYKILRGLTEHDFDEAPLQPQSSVYNTHSSCKSMLTLPQFRTSSY